MPDDAAACSSASESCRAAAGAAAAAAAAVPQPDRVTRWVRQALQQSWGAWLAGGASTAAWDMCREGATDADAVFMDDMRRMPWQGDSTAAQAAARGYSHNGGDSGGPAADGRGSDTEYLREGPPRSQNGEDPGTIGDLGDWAPLRDDGPDASPWLAGDTGDGSQHGVGAVVDDDDNLGGLGEPLEPPDCLAPGASVLPLPEQRFQGYGPELCSYIYGHVRPPSSAEQVFPRSRK